MKKDKMNKFCIYYKFRLFFLYFLLFGSGYRMIGSILIVTVKVKEEIFSSYKDEEL